MRISSVSVSGFGSAAIVVQTSDESFMDIRLSEADRDRFLTLAQQIVDEQRAELIKQVSAPFPALADFSEVSSADDVPF